MDHTVPTVGWVLDEMKRPGALDADQILPILNEHNIPHRRLRDFKTGTPIELPNGEFVSPFQAML